MTRAYTWHGRRGTVILGPTEHRIARWLADRCAHGRITMRTADLAAATHVGTHEAYRITARLRVLGLFGIENDRGGTKGGRRYWRTAIEHDTAALDVQRHRAAWARIVAWARAGRVTAVAALASIRANHTRRTVDPARPRPAPTARPAPPAGGPSFLDRLIAGGLSPGLVPVLAEHRHR